MQKIVFLAGFLLCFLSGFAQETLQSYPTKKIAFSKDTISIEKFSLNTSFFEIKDKNGKVYIVSMKTPGSTSFVGRNN